MAPPRMVLRSLVVALVAATLTALGGPAEAGCGAGQLAGALLRGAEGQLASLGNTARGASGAGTLAVDGELSSVARAHAERMAASGRIFHNDGYFALIGDLGATMLAENVGMGCSATKIHDAFLASPSHRANLLNPALTHAGFGAASDPSGVLYVVQAFAAYPSAPPPPPPPPAPPVSATPVPVQPTATPAPPTPAPTVRTAPDPTANPDPTASPDPTPTVVPTQAPDRTVLAAGRPGAPVAGSPSATAEGPRGRGPVMAAAVAAMGLALVVVRTGAGRLSGRA